MSPRSVLVTGASRGIGFGIANRLAQQGACLTIAGRDASRLADAASTFAAAGAANVVAVAGDVTDDGYLADLVSSHRERYGDMDALVANAGQGSAGAIADFHVKRFDKQIATNLRSVYLLVQLCIPLLQKAAAMNPRGAKVIAMASITGVHAETELAAYGAAKAGLISLCRSLNAELNSAAIQATAVAPGFVDTDMAGYKHDVIAAADMIPVEDVVELVDGVLRLSSRSLIHEIVIARAGTNGFLA